MWPRHLGWGPVSLERWPGGTCTHWKSAALPRRTPKPYIATYRTSMGLGWSGVLHCATVPANRGSLSEESRLSKREAKKWLKTVAIWSS